MGSIPQHRGFTLIEVVVVIVIIGIALALAGNQFSRSLPASKLDATVREMTAAFKQAKVQSSVTGQRQYFVMNLDTRQYGPDGKPLRTWPEEVAITISDPVTGIIVHGEYRFVFYPGGASDVGSIMFSAGAKRVQLQMDPIVGAIVSRIDR